MEYHLKFKGAPNPREAKVLYYLLRYADLTTAQGEWLSEAVAANHKGAVPEIVLDKLDWGHKYKLELYAGNKYGLGEPELRTLRRPKGWSCAFIFHQKYS